MERKKIAYISGTRADFGLMTPVLLAIEGSPKLSLTLYATGEHLMPEFGKTVEEVRKAFHGVREISAVFSRDTREGMADFTATFLGKVVSVFEKDRPDFVLTLGDRPEMLAVAVACLYLGIPTGQLHAGDRSLTVDEVARHAITKLSSLHFSATKGATERVLKLGEEPWRVNEVGAPALDVILHERLPTNEDVATFLHIPGEAPFILVTLHPTSESWSEAGGEMREVLTAVKATHRHVVVLYPHADAGGRLMIAEIEKEKDNPLFRIFPSVPYAMFLALEREASVWVGNSSAIMIESSSFGTPCLNVGSRQKRREHGGNVTDVACDATKLTAVLSSLLLSAKKPHLPVVNPWGDGRTATRVVSVLEKLPSDATLLTKQITY